jgi:hypothetical protein
VVFSESTLPMSEINRDATEPADTQKKSFATKLDCANRRRTLRWLATPTPRTNLAAADKVETALSRPQKDRARDVLSVFQPRAAEPAATANALTGPAISHSAPPLAGALSFEENRLRAPARG